MASTSHASETSSVHNWNTPSSTKGMKKPLNKPYTLPPPSTCTCCGAKLFRNESPNFCCNQGEIHLPSNTVPEVLRCLFLSNDDTSKNFRNHIMFYNSSFAFTSLGVKKDHEFAHRNRGIYTFRVQGQVYHFINDILPTEERPRYIQLYFYDTDHELMHRLQIALEFQKRVIDLLMKIMDSNPYAKFFRSLRTLEISEETRILIRADPTHDQRTHNAPTTSQIAAIWVEDDTTPEPLKHDILVYACSGQPHRILHYYGCYDPLQYPLLFPFGETGWHRAIYRRGYGRHRRHDCPTFPISEVLVQSADSLIETENQVVHTTDTDKKVSCREYYCYRLQIRICDNSILLRCGRLLQQFIVDMYIKIETTRLDFIKCNQKLIRAELYQGIIDSYSAGETHASNIGHSYILPAAFIGCDRDLRCRYLNSMGLVQRYGKPDIFLTMTCNPRWPEIERELLPFEEAQNRPDLTARIFRAKLLEVKKEIVEKKLFGKVAGYVYVVEFQKRGLPHAHFLIILDSYSRVRTADQYDDYVCAEIPDVSENSHLHGAVLKHMMHGPCGLHFLSNPCMRNSKCKNHYPRDFSEMTTTGRNSYPIYRRRNDGISVLVRGASLDNRWVVLYNPFLLSKYDCHINVEICSTVKAVKYLYKYVYKGHDRVSFAIADEHNRQVVDEIAAYQNGRWVSPPEAAWRIFSFHLNEIHPNIVVLHVHLPNMQTVTFRSFEQISTIAEDCGRSRSMLTAFFEKNRQDSFARTLLYQQFPEHYVWNDHRRSKFWHLRQKGFAIGRLVYANPSEGERYYLRLLLANVRGPKSFKDLLMVNNSLCSSFRDSAYRRGLLESDNSTEHCLREACQFQLPFALRRLFATLLIYCQPKNPKELWDKYFTDLSEDFAFTFPSQPRRVRQMTLRSIASIIESMGKSITNSDLGELLVEDNDVEQHLPKEIEEELNIPITAEDLNGVNLLNSEQKRAYDTIYSRVMRRKHGAFFLDGPGGTGKFFLYTTLLANLRAKGVIALAVASSGIAASNIAGGRTANSRFKIPLDIEENQSSQISKQSGLGELIRTCRLIIWDEASMARRQAIEHFERTLRDVCSNSSIFGGKVVVFGGDFRQVLPVIPKSTLREVVNASFVMSPLWPKLEKLRLTTNMRAIHDPIFSDTVLCIGEGRSPFENGKIVPLPRSIVLAQAQECQLLDLLIQSVYPDVSLFSSNPSSMTKRAILTPKNEDTELINSILVSRQSGFSYEYKSFDEVVDITTEQYPIEFLNTLNPSGLPPHSLVLKVNSPIILLRNLDPTSGLCNGTRLICKAFSRNVIDAEIIVGHHKGERVFIPRIPLQPSPSDKYPFHFRRKQFPIKLSFAMTINKAQGQTLDKVGVFLPHPVFSYGQLYVALSRAKKSEDVRVVISPQDGSDDSWRETKNIVCYDVLRLVGVIMNVLKIPLREVTPQSRNFAVVARLEAIAPPALSQKGGTMYQKLLFRDAEGTDMSVTLFDKDIENFSMKLKEGNEYQITNPGVSLVPPYGRENAKKYQMKVNDRTTIDELPEHTTTTARSYYVPLSSCYDYLGHQGRIDIIGIAVHVDNTRKVMSTYKDTEYDTRDIILIDKSMVTKKISVWRDFVVKEAQQIADVIDAQPIVTASHVIAGKFGGGNWSSSFFSTIKVNNEVPEVEELRRWANENTEEIRRIRDGLRAETGESSAKRHLSKSGNTKTIISIVSLNEQDEGVTIWIQGRIVDIINLDRCFYISCDHCLRTTVEEVGKTFYCDKEYPPHTGTAVYRFDLRIVFTDETASTKITLFSDLAKSVLKRTTEEIAQYTPEEHRGFIDEVLTSIKTRIFNIKLVTFRTEGIRRQMKFRTLQIEEIDN